MGGVFPSCRPTPGDDNEDNRGDLCSGAGNCGTEFNEFNFKENYRDSPVLLADGSREESAKKRMERMLSGAREDDFAKNHLHAEDKLRRDKEIEERGWRDVDDYDRSRALEHESMCIEKSEEPMEIRDSLASRSSDRISPWSELRRGSVQSNASNASDGVTHSYSGYSIAPGHTDPASPGALREFIAYSADGGMLVKDTKSGETEHLDDVSWTAGQKGPIRVKDSCGYHVVM